MKAKFFKDNAIKDLLSNVADNLDLYRSGNFDIYANDIANYFESDLEINEEKMGLINCDEKNDREVENCLLMFEATNGVTGYLARDERFWTYLVHTNLLEYARKRWPIPENKDKAIKHIKAHFFCIGARGIERDNAASRLWWLAYLAGRVRGLSLEDALTCLLYQADVRANIVERPTTSQNINLFSVVLKKLHVSYKTDKALFERDRFRNVMKALNLSGGVKLLTVLPEQSISKLFDECINNTK